MRLFHYTREPFTFDPSRRYEQKRRGETCYFKPIGLWLSAENGDEGETTWKTWCEGETWNEEGLAHRTEFEIVGGNILMIDSVVGLDALTRRYKLDGRAAVSIYRDYLDWPRLVQDYDGIVIAPYQWERRMSLMWYYPWDCASGCVWNLAAIRPVETPVAGDGWTRLEPSGLDGEVGRPDDGGRDGRNSQNS